MMNARVSQKLKQTLAENKVTETEWVDWIHFLYSSLHLCMCNVLFRYYMP